MPLLLLAIGLILIIAGIRGSISALASQVTTDITTPVNGVSFLAWFAAIVLIGLIGYVPQAQGISRALLALVVLVIVLQNKGGFFTQFVQQLQTAPGTSTLAASGASATTSGGSSSLVSGLTGLFSGGTGAGSTTVSPSPSGLSLNPMSIFGL